MQTPQASNIRGKARRRSSSPTTTTSTTACCISAPRSSDAQNVHQPLGSPNQLPRVRRLPLQRARRRGTAVLTVPSVASGELESPSRARLGLLESLQPKQTRAWLPSWRETIPSTRRMPFSCASKRPPSATAKPLPMLLVLPHLPPSATAKPLSLLRMLPYVPSNRREPAARRQSRPREKQWSLSTFCVLLTNTYRPRRKCAMMLLSFFAMLPLLRSRTQSSKLQRGFLTMRASWFGPAQGCGGSQNREGRHRME
mmetsp:Transcript_9821/g.29364  ORF Transcript_9821/g.29364 Transcript_9821/m.29364 type:complete len:255 (+) Transcript_9821:355-1119(+)